MAKPRKTKYPGIKRLAPGRYEIRFRVKQPTANKLKEVRRERSGIDLEEALELQQVWKRQAREGVEPERVERMTVAQYARSWMASKALKLRMGSARRYAHALDGFILPELGEYYIDALNPKIVRDWLTKVSQWINPRTKQLYSTESINGHFRVLRAMLRDAAADIDGLDPTRRVTILENRGKGSRKARTLEARQLGEFLRALLQIAPRHYPMAVVAFLTGMRFSEFSALRWEDILEDEGLILLRRSQYRGHLAPTKNKEPRVIPMDDQGLIKDALRTQRQWLLKLQKRKGLKSGYVRGFADGWIFPSRVGGLSCASLLDKPFAMTAKEIGLGHKVTSHDCRRTFNTLARQAQVPDRVIQALVGHHSDEMTERYDRVEVLERKMAVGQVIEFAGLTTKVGG